MEVETLKKVVSHSVATDLANSVLPASRFPFSRQSSRSYSERAQEKESRDALGRMCEHGQKGSERRAATPRAARSRLH